MKRMTAPGLIVLLLLAGCTTYVDVREEGITQFQLGQTEQARQLFQEALDREPGDAASLYYMGRIELLRNRPAWALYYFQRCLDTDPSFEIARPWLTRARQAAQPVGDKLIFQPLESPR